MRILRVTADARGPGASGGCALLLALLFAAAGVGAQDTSVTFLEGFPELRSAGGQTFDLDFGDAVDQGDSVVTGRGDFVELRQGEGTTIRVEPDTVFTLREVAEGGSRQSVMTNSVGEVRYRFNRLAGREPRVGSAAVVAGIRGTELTIYAGSDGSSLFLVDSGLVEVTSGGETVELSEAQAVEVGAGEPPGEVFEWRGRELDFSSWDQSRLDSFIDEPARSVELLLTRLEEFAEGYEEYQGLAEELAIELEAVRDSLGNLEDEDDEDTLREELVTVRENRGNSILNYRYFALSGLSLRRYVLGNLYMRMKTRFILDQNNGDFRAFLTAYEEFLQVYENRIVPGLDESDI